jgi:hypothetical protein
MKIVKIHKLVAFCAQVLSNEIKLMMIYIRKLFKIVKVMINSVNKLTIRK